MLRQAKSITHYAVQRLLRATLSRFGLEIKRVQQHSHWTPANLRKAGFSPRTVVDVGAGAKGTLQLYEAFPEAFQVLVEPLKEHEPQLKGILKEYEGTYFLTAVGAREEKLDIHVEPQVIDKSSIYPRTDLTSTGDQLDKRAIPVTTLDVLMEKHNFRPPFGLKIDTEGFEYQVIEGASNFLRETQFVIAEVSVAKRFIGSYSFAEFIEIMDRNGFYLCDILDVVRWRSPSSELCELRYVDAMFRKESQA
jgi:FkbM family methyltransferase